MLLRLFVSQRGRVPSVAAEFELSPMQAHVLRLLEPDQPLPMRALAGKLCCDPSNVTGIVDRLEERGLVQRAVLAGRPADARAGRHRGRRPAARPHAGAAGRAARSRSPRLSESDQRTLHDILSRAMDG